MSCGICGESTGLFGGNVAFTCPFCKENICKACAEKYGNARTWGGVFGDAHAEITCPSCHNAIKIR